jgi:hypothetical protein
VETTGTPYVPQLHILLDGPGLERHAGAVSDRIAPGVRHGEGPALGGVHALRPLEPGTDRGAVGGGGVRGPGIPGRAGPRSVGEHRAGEGRRRHAPDPDRRRCAAGARRVALRRSRGATAAARLAGCGRDDHRRRCDHDRWTPALRGGQRAGARPGIRNPDRGERHGTARRAPRRAPDPGRALTDG